MTASQRRAILSISERIGVDADAECREEFDPASLFPFRRGAGENGVGQPIEHAVGIIFQHGEPA